MPDSIANIQQAADSAPVYYAPQYTEGFPQPEPGDTVQHHSLQALPTLEVPQGAEPAKPQTSPLHDTGSMSILMAALFLVVVSYRTGYKYIEQFAHNLFSVRRRENAFEDRTINETRILTALTLCTSVMEGFVAFYAIDHYVPSLSAALHGSILAHIGLFSGIALVFYLAQLLVYAVVGNVFADGVATKLWSDGFKAANSLLGILLTPVVGLLLVYPAASKILVIISCFLYFCCRIAFISKGFRIFYTNFPSLVYFILYLCSVEIVPLVLLSAGTVYLCTVFTF